MIEIALTQYLRTFMCPRMEVLKKCKNAKGLINTDMHTHIHTHTAEFF